MSLANLNNPAVTSMINQASVSARAEGIDSGLNVALLAIYKMWQDGDIVDYQSLAETVVKNVKSFSSNKKEYDKWAKKFNDYQTDDPSSDED